MPEPTAEEVIRERRKAKADRIIQVFREHNVTATDVVMILSDRDPDNRKFWTDLSKALKINYPSEQTRLEVIRGLLQDVKEKTK